MKHQYFILVLAHSFHGRLRRIHVPHRFLYVLVTFALIGGFSILSLVSSYARMALKVANITRYGMKRRIYALATRT